ncbi:histidine kinase [Arthrobacter sp. ATA002]|uniref:sensor histidine kinase n=1 Tax=Arthrobacter sp. ATA002 TaxID=2991715 RepID=UPI0022A7FE12|nr:histidine kinase [Arthrobacter sp. ATA002]WAP53088.1 histidine kinase [Arthrobacter sp. ATA002]
MLPPPTPDTAESSAAEAGRAGALDSWGSGIWPTGAATAAAYLAAGLVLKAAGVNSLDMLPPVLEAPVPVWFAILVLGCAGTLFRRRRVSLMLAVTGTAIAAGVLTGAGLINYLLLFEFFYSGILFGSPRLSRALEKAALATAAFIVAAVSAVHRDWAFLLVGVVQATLTCLMPLWWAGTLRRQADRAEQERTRAETERLNAERAAEMAELSLQVALASERAAMARELHDAIAGRLSAVALQSAAALSAADSALDRQVLAQVRSESVHALEEMRAMIELLQSRGSGPSAAGANPVAVSPFAGRVPMAGGLEQLRSLTESARLAGNPAELTLDADPELPVLLQSSIFRIVQESLTNAVRHAPGEPVKVVLRQEAGEVQLTVSNSLPAAADAAGRPGPAGTSGGTAPGGNGTGLRNMALRTAQLSGVFSAGRTRDDDGGSGPARPDAPADTWQVKVRLPLDGAQ